LGFRVSGFGFRVPGSRFRGSGFEFQDPCFESRFRIPEFLVSGFGFRVSGNDFGLRFRFSGGHTRLRVPVNRVEVVRRAVRQVPIFGQVLCWRLRSAIQQATKGCLVAERLGERGARASERASEREVVERGENETTGYESCATGNQLRYPQDPPSVRATLPTAGSMDYPVMGRSGNPCVVRKEPCRRFSSSLFYHFQA